MPASEFLLEQRNISSTVLCGSDSLLRTVRSDSTNGQQTAKCEAVRAGVTVLLQLHQEVASGWQSNTHCIRLLLHRPSAPFACTVRCTSLSHVLINVNHPQGRFHAIKPSDSCKNLTFRLLIPALGLSSQFNSFCLHEAETAVLWRWTLPTLFNLCWFLWNSVLLLKLCWHLALCWVLCEYWVLILGMWTQQDTPEGV
jgi:hypothetical protein